MTDDKKVMGAWPDVEIVEASALQQAQEERDKWKWEYENLCKFANDYELKINDLQAKLATTNSNWPHEKKLHEENKALREKLEIAREALEFYANIYHWEDNRNIYYFDCAHVSDFETIVLKNGDDRDGNKVAGKTARTALKSIGESEK